MSDITTKHMIPLSEPEISGNEWKYIKDCLDTGWVSSAGNYISRFEETIAGYIGVKHAVATVNGTSALHVSLIVCGVQPNDEVIVPSLTFIAPVNVVRYCNAYPVFMDCERDTLCIDVQKVIDFINNECERSRAGYIYNKKTKRRIKAIIPVHIFGHPADMDELLDICKENNIDIIEDAAESLGSEYKGKKTGSFGSIGGLSFNGNKIITTGGGGMIITDDEEVAKRARHLTTQAKSNSLEYDHDEVGYNYRLTNIQAAMGIAQMERLEEFIGIKRRNAGLYRELLSGVKEVQFLYEKPWVKSNFWFYTISVPASQRKPLMDYLVSKDIQIRPVWKPIHTLPMYRDHQSYRIEDAINAYESCINLPCSVSLKDEDIAYVAESIAHYFRNL